MSRQSSIGRPLCSEFRSLHYLLLSLSIVGSYDPSHVGTVVSVWRAWAGHLMTHVGWSRD